MNMKLSLMTVVLTLLLTTAPVLAQHGGSSHQSAGEEGDLLFIRENGKFGYIDRSGKLVIPCIYENTYGFTEGLAAVKVKGKIGYIDVTGKMVIPPTFDDAYAFFEGLAWVRISGLYAWIDRTGKVVIEPQAFEDVAAGFSDGMCAVKIDGDWGYIDRSGKLVIKPRYDQASKFKRGTAQVRQASQYSWIDKTGKAIWSLASPNAREGEPLALFLFDGAPREACLGEDDALDPDSLQPHPDSLQMVRGLFYPDAPRAVAERTPLCADRYPVLQTLPADFGRHRHPLAGRAPYPSLQFPHDRRSPRLPPRDEVT
jgi:hypothetical protein